MNEILAFLNPGSVERMNLIFHFKWQNGNSSPNHISHVCIENTKQVHAHAHTHEYQQFHVILSLLILHPFLLMQKRNQWLLT